MHRQCRVCPSEYSTIAIPITYDCALRLREMQKDDILLHKLLFVAQAYYWVVFNDRLFETTFEAHNQGPVDINLQHYTTIHHYSHPGHNLPKSVEVWMDAVEQAHHHFDELDWMLMAQQPESPWHLITAQSDDNDNTNITIPESMMIDYYQHCPLLPKVMSLFIKKACTSLLKVMDSITLNHMLEPIKDNLWRYCHQLMALLIENDARLPNTSFL